MEFLSFVVSKEGIKADPKKVKSILKFNYPGTLKELRTFLGLSSYYSPAKSHTKMYLNDSTKKAYEELKNPLVSRVILLYPDFSNDFQS